MILQLLRLLLIATLTTAGVFASLEQRSLESAILSKVRDRLAGWHELVGDLSEVACQYGRLKG